jgi:hypothetical protein
VAGTIRATRYLRVADHTDGTAVPQPNAPVGTHQPDSGQRAYWGIGLMEFPPASSPACRRSSFLTFVLTETFEGGDLGNSC